MSGAAGAAGPLISVVIPAHNRAALLPRALRSALDQTYSRLEVIVVDDASTDGTAEALRSFTDPRLVVLRHERNRGGGAARNTGIRAARGEFIAFLDSDDEWLPRKLERQLEAFQRSDLPDVGAALCGCVYVTAGGEHTAVTHARGRIFDRLLKEQGGLDGVQSTSALVRHRPHAPEFLFDERLPSAQDWDYLLQVTRHHPIEVVPEVLVRVRRDHDGARIGRDLSATIRGRELVLDKYKADYARAPDAHAVVLFRLALAHVMSGDQHAARRRLIEAARVDARPRYVVHAIAASVGPLPLRLTLRLERALRHLRGAGA